MFSLAGEHRKIIDATMRRYAAKDDARALLMRFLRAVDRGKVERDGLRRILNAAGKLRGDTDDVREAILQSVLNCGDDSLIRGVQREGLEPRSLAIAPYGSLVIAVEETKAPSKGWLKAQRRPPRSNGPFWEALCLDGGSVLVTSADVYILGKPNDEHLDAAVDAGNFEAVRLLVELFPKLAKSRKVRKKL